MYDIRRYKLNCNLGLLISIVEWAQAAFDSELTLDSDSTIGGLYQPKLDANMGKMITAHEGQSLQFVGKAA